MHLTTNSPHTTPPAHELFTELTADERAALAEQLGDLWQFPAHWFWFSTFGSGPLTYPHWDAARLDVPDADQLQKRLRDIEASRFWKMRSVLARLLGRA